MVRRFVLALAALAGFTGLSSSGARAAPDIPYYKLNYADYDYTYAWEEKQARHYANFYWDGKLYCRYPTGWNGPGAYHVGDRFRRGQGWDGGYPWQGPGTPADHDDARSFDDYKATYAREFGRGPFCRPHHRVRRHHPIVLRRKD